MLRLRVIPFLLLKGRGLVKTINFRDPKYVGDPINAVRIFNQKEVDELVILDIMATQDGRGPNFELIMEIAEECFMPLAYGGGVRTIEDVRRLLSLGVEKVVINTAAIDNLNLLREASTEFGAQAIVASIDVKKKLFGGYQVMRLGRKSTSFGIEQFALACQQAGAGEIALNSIDHDGTMNGMDLNLIQQVSSSLEIPLLAIGGVGSISDIKAAKKAGASAVGAGSFFVFQGPHRAVLISYPSYDQLIKDIG